MRKSTRAEEIAAINKAIAVLRSDDARDILEKSFESQDYLFLQEGEANECSQTHLQEKATTLLLAISRTTKSRRPGALAALIARATETGETRGLFDKALTMIDEPLAGPLKERDAVLKKKEECKKDRMEPTRKAKDISQEIDEKSEFIERKTELTEELSKTIYDAKAEIAEPEKAL